MSLPSAIVLAMGLMLAATQLAQGLRAVKTADRYVTVKGLAEMEVPADLVIWPLTFVEAADELPVLTERLDGHVAQVRRYLAAQGLAAAEVSVAPPRIQDFRAEAYGDPNAQRFRYRAELTLTIRSTDAPGVKQAMQNAGELLRQGIVFAAWGPAPEYLFTRLNEIKPALIAEATANARTAAEQFARDSGSRVGAIRSANQGVISINDRDAATPETKIVRVVSTVEYQLR